MALDGWAMAVSDRSVVDLAARIGVSTCPMCSHVPSGREGRRESRIGSVRATHNLWVCYACSAGGTSLHFLCAAVLGSLRPAGSAHWRRLEAAARALWSGLPVDGQRRAPEPARKGRDWHRYFAQRQIAWELAQEAATAAGDGGSVEELCTFYPSALHYVLSGGIAAAPRVAQEYERRRAASLDNHWQNEEVRRIFREIILEGDGNVEQDDYLRQPGARSGAQRERHSYAR